MSDNKTTFRLTDPIDQKRLNKAAKAQHRSVSGQIRRYIREGLDRDGITLDDEEK